MFATRDDDAPRDVRRSWLFYAISGALLLLAIIMLTGLVTLGVISWRVRASYFASQRAIEAEVIRIRAAGEPLAADEMHAFHRLADGVPDATPAWLKTLATFDSDQLRDDVEDLPLVRVGRLVFLPPKPSAEEKATILRLFEMYDSTVQAALEAAKDPGDTCLPIKFEDAYGDERVESQAINSLVRLLGLKAQMHGFNGAADAAIESVSAMLAASDNLKDQPSGLDHVRRLATLTQINQHIYGLIHDVQLNEDQLANLQSLLDQVDLEGGLTIALMGDRSLMYRASLSNSPPGLVQLTQGDTTGQEPGMPQDCELQLKYQSQLIAASRAPFPQAHRAAKGIEEDLMRLSEGWSEFDRYYRSMAVADIRQSVLRFSAHGRSLAKRDTMRVGIAAERYRLKTGQFPARLDDLVPDYLPAIPIDPFDGRPLRMKVSDQVVVVYSIGEDLVDDDGREEIGDETKDISAPIYVRKGRGP